MLRGEADQLARVAGASGNLVGRTRDKAILSALLPGSPLITVTGLPGVGKTAIALAVAVTTSRTFPDGVWPVPLGQLRQHELVPHTVAQALDVPDQLSRDVLDSLTTALRDRQLLLVLDTCEHVARGCAAVARAITAHCPGVRVIATSREPLRLPDERLYTLRPLTLGHAIVLFGKRARSASPGFHMTPENRPVVAEICRRLDRLPLAIELAARQLATSSLPELRADLQHGLGLLHNGVDAPGRHQTLSAAIGWTHELCSPAERLLWARLSVFAEPFRHNDASLVCSDEYLPTTVVATALPGLASRSVLLVDGPADDGTSYRMPETIRAYGSAMLLRLGDEAAVQARYRLWRTHRK